MDKEIDLDKIVELHGSFRNYVLHARKKKKVVINVSTEQMSETLRFRTHNLINLSTRTSRPLPSISLQIPLG